MWLHIHALVKGPLVVFRIGYFIHQITFVESSFMFNVHLNTYADMGAYWHHIIIYLDTSYINTEICQTISYPLRFPWLLLIHNCKTKTPQVSASRSHISEIYIKWYIKTYIYVHLFRFSSITFPLVENVRSMFVLLLSSRMAMRSG